MLYQSLTFDAHYDHKTVIAHLHCVYVYDDDDDECSNCY